MKEHAETVEDVDSSSQPPAAPRPGLVVVFADGKAACQAIAAGPEGLVLGRVFPGDAFARDERLSRQHARVEWAGSGWRITDLGSRNGTFVDGRRITEATLAPAEHVLRTGHVVMLAMGDAGLLLDRGVEVSGGIVIGPRLRAAHEAIARAAKHGDTLFIRGESGSGKEIAARTFHSAGARAPGPFVAVNCAAIPPSLAERLLFGARRGAYSGADEDATGHLQAASGGTIFLDEIAELDAAVQAKLLRVIETKEVLALGASTPKRVDVGVCAATHRDLRAEVASGKFREDLYFRIGRPEVEIPPLRMRREELPWIIEDIVRRASPPVSPHALLVEACLLRRWPGNARELAAEIKNAAACAGGAGRPSVEPLDLAPGAGIEFDAPSTRPSSTPPSVARTLKSERPPDDAIEHALREEGGNVTRAARRLGLHRNQIRRWLERRGG